MTGRHYATYFDSYYLTRATALWGSLAEHDPEATLWALCLDDSAEAAVRRLAPPNVRIVMLAELERADRRLLDVRPTRSRVEYYFTLGPAFLLHVLEIAALPAITYVDGDLYFFSDPTPVFDEIGTASIAVVEHRFAPGFEHELVHGRFNVAWNMFRSDDDGLECLHWWRERCLEWCYDRVEPGRFADQRYLDDWPQRFRGVHIVQHRGVDAAPWNLANQPVHRRAEHVFIGDDPLVAFHFQGIKRRNRWFVDTNLGLYDVRPNRVVRKQIYAPYVQALRSAARALERPDLESARQQRGRSRLPLPIARARSFALGVGHKRILFAPMP